MGSEEFVPNELLRWARSLKGWSQAELAEKVGTSFEMVSRWERGVTVPSPHYRRRLSAVLGQTPEELGLVRDLRNSFTPPSSPFVLLASSHTDAEKAIVSQLKTTLQGRGITLWNSRQFGRQGTENSRAALYEVVRSALVILVIISPEARSSRHVQGAFEIARIYQRPVCGVWIEGQHLEHCLPERRVELAGVIDAREKDTLSTLEELAITLEQILCTSQDGTEAVQLSFPDTAVEVATLANHPTEMQILPNPYEPPVELVPTQSKKMELASPPSQHSLEPTNGVKPMPSNGTGLSRSRVGLLIGLAILVIVGGLLGSLNLLAHFGVMGAYSGPSAVQVVRGGTWAYGLPGDAVSLIPNGDLSGGASGIMDQALYLPLFYGNAQGVIHPGAATEVPSIQNRGVSADATTWTFHLRPGLVWSDGQPYNARDVDFTWRLWANPRFGAVTTLGLNLISWTEISADYLSITFHLKQPFAPFLADLWVDGIFAPLPAHHFSMMAPEQILKSPDNRNPQVTSGPFMMAESVPGDHYTVVRNSHYYLAREGRPYLDKVVFTIIDASSNASSELSFLKVLRSGSLDANGFIVLGQDPNDFQNFERLQDYTIVYPPTLNGFEALYFNFHNTVLASHLEVRQAMAMAVDQQALIAGPLHGFGVPLCTDHPTAYHPGYEPYPPCPLFDLGAANKLLDDTGWVKGPDSIRTKGGQRLEFEYSTTNVVDSANPARLDVEKILQHDFQQIGIKLDIQNYPGETFFGSFLPQGKASPSTGAVAGRYDIAEWANSLSYDPDDSLLFSCNQFPPVGFNVDFYCNPALDALYTQEQATGDVGVRQQIFEQIHRIYLTQFPFITLYSVKFFGLARKGTHNYQQGPVTDTYNIAEWWCDNGKC